MILAPVRPLPMLNVCSIRHVEGVVLQYSRVLNRCSSLRGSLPVHPCHKASPGPLRLQVASSLQLQPCWQHPIPSSFVGSRMALGCSSRVRLHRFSPTTLPLPHLLPCQGSSRWQASLDRHWRWQPIFSPSKLYQEDFLTFFHQLWGHPTSAQPALCLHRQVALHRWMLHLHKYRLRKLSQRYSISL